MCGNKIEYGISYFLKKTWVLIRSFSVGEAVVLLMSIHNMFSSRNKKNINHNLDTLLSQSYNCSHSYI